MKRTRMNKVVCLFAASASLAAFGLTDVYWVGGTSGSWKDTANWSCSDWQSPSKPNSIDCIVHITNEVPVEITIPGSETYTVGGIYFSGANHMISSGDRWSYLSFGVEAAGQTNVIDVAQDITATIPNVMAKNDNWSDVLKTGGGTLDVVGRLCKSTQRFKSLEIVDGVFRYNDSDNYGSFRIAGVCTVRSGAKFVNMGDNRIFDGQIVNLEKGAIFDSNGKYGKFGGITGYGVVTNLGKNSSYWYAGPLDFAGQVYGPIVLSPRMDYVKNAEGYLCVGAADTLANATVKLAGDAAYTNLLRFASGVGSFEIQSLDLGTSSHTVVFADADGDPITLKIGDVTIIGAADFAGTAVLDLQDGIMEVNGGFSQPSAAISAPAEGKMLFNGGVLRAASVGNQEWWTGANDPDELVKAYIGPAGAIVDVKSDKYNRLLTIGWPFVTGVDNGTDGGFVKLGRGRLQLSKPYAGTGVFEAREGRVDVNSGMGTTPFGSASVRIGMGEMQFLSPGFYSLSATTGASLSYTNCATLHLTNGVALTIGDVGAMADSTVARCGHGVLTVMSGTAEEAIGVNASVVVNGGLSNDATTGILRQPIFERREMPSNNRYRACFLKCAANNALVPATPVEFDPATSSDSTVAQITGSSAVTVSANASVGALVVERSNGAGLTVNDGVTLSVGPNTAGSVAPILLNNVSLSGGSNAKAGIAGTGTIDFGASEGVIVVNGNASLLYPVNIDTALAGSGGVTFAAPTLFADGIRGCVVLNKAGTYTGGTWIENVHVSTTAAGSFGTGTIHVSGNELDGGALEIAAKHSSTFANPLEISGYGPQYSSGDILPGYYGALIVRRGGVTLSGGLTLVADSKIASGARGGQKPVTFTAPIVGPGKLTVSGTSPFRFDAANTYAGGTVIINGIVEVTDAGTLGSGPVKICAGGVLRFVNTAAKTVSNVITGDGRIEMNGAAVTLTSADGFEGDIAGNVSAVGDDGYVKSGEGTVVFTNALSYMGATTVSAGMLRLGQVPLGIPAASESIAFHLDASAGDTITEEDGAVVSWTDADGRDIAFTNVVGNGPSRTIGALNGMDALYFNGEKARRLIANAATPEFRTVFLVNRVDGGDRPGGSTWGNVGIIGKLDADSGLRFKEWIRPNQAYTELKADSMFQDGVLHINGDSDMSPATLYDSMKVYNDTFVITEAEVATPVQNTTFAIGDYINGRSYFGDIAEVIAYDRWLTDEERIATERYLQNKWGLKEVAASGVFTNVLPVATALTVAEGATLDLAGGYQEVASLSGAGTIANSFETQATIVLSSGTSGFSGSFSGDIYLEVAEGATLDLCGGTLTVAGVGGSGIISNGTLVVTGEIQPGGRGAVGTLTVDTAPVVSGATLVVDGDETAVDDMVVEGDFDMTGLSLNVPRCKLIPYGRHAVVEADDGALTGEFSSTDLPSGGRYGIEYTESAAVLCREKPGLLVIFQ